MKGLLVDFGGVLTTNVFESFRAFCEREGLDPGKVKRLFREDPQALGELRRLERGGLTEDEFAERFGPLLGIEDTDGLVDRLFAGMEADEAMLDAVRAARRAGVRTGLISNSWGAGRYDRTSFEELFDGVVISGEVRLNKPQAEIYELGRAAGRAPARGVRVRRRPAGELRGRGGGGNDRGTTPRYRAHGGGARATAGRRARVASAEPTQTRG